MTYDPLRVLTNLTLVHTYEASYTFTGQVLSAGQAFLDCEFTKASASASAGLIRFAGSSSRHFSSSARSCITMARSSPSLLMLAFSMAPTSQPGAGVEGEHASADDVRDARGHAAARGLSPEAPYGHCRRYARPRVELLDDAGNSWTVNCGLHLGRINDAAARSASASRNLSRIDAGCTTGCRLSTSPISISSTIIRCCTE